MACRIGIPLGLDDRGRWRAGRRYQYLDADYAAAVEAAGAVPLHLPLQRDVTRALESVDGLLVPGGDDLRPPRAYPSGVQFDLVPDAQLAFDRALLEAALAAGRPVLGVCYGMQLLALAHGGALHYDLATDAPGSEPHQLRDPDARHAIRPEPRTRLAAILGGDAARVNSAHHQAVSDPGTLRVAARADDGVIEAIEADGEPFRLGVQWHPEKLGDAGSAALFAAFVDACRR